MFRHWFAMRSHCSHCGISLATGNSVGANLLNLVLAELTLVAGLGTVVARTWPDPPWRHLQYGAPILMVIAPLVFFPLSRVLFVAIDLAMHPSALPDPPAHGIENLPT
ncbi:MAG: DUF983 domain-containing protein [Gemmatimonadales bacterium]